MTSTIEPTPGDKGLVLTLRITDYDNLIINFNGKPVGGQGGGKFLDREAAIHVLYGEIAKELRELFKQSAQRRANQPPEAVALIHEGNLARYSVPLRSTTGQGEVVCATFAGSIEDAGPAAIEKMKDKYR